MPRLSVFFSIFLFFHEQLFVCATLQLCTIQDVRKMQLLMAVQLSPARLDLSQVVCMKSGP